MGMDTGQQTQKPLDVVKRAKSMYVILTEINVVQTLDTVKKAPSVTISSVPALPEVVTKLLYLVFRREGFTKEKLKSGEYYGEEPVNVCKTHMKKGRRIRYPSTLDADIMKTHLEKTVQALLISTL